jgi:hypothetical protein
MRPSKCIRVRPLRVSDFKFVRRLASKQRNFTVPPLYILWLLTRMNARSCMVAEYDKVGPLAYLVSFLVNSPRGKVLYVWQMAASKAGLQLGAIDLLLLKLRAFMRQSHIQRVFFTADPKSSEFRAIRRYAYALFDSVPRSQQILPTLVSRNERQFVMKVT